jgi:enoyl-CoA hydratase
LTEDLVLLDKADGIATLTLNRPDKLNAMNEALLLQLSGRLHELDDADDVSVVIIRGAGRSFCAGYDISPDNDGKRSQFLTGGDVVGDRWRLRRNSKRWLELWDLQTPVIAQVHGHCLAAGSELALMCDLIVAADDAEIGFPAVRGLGVPPLSVYPIFLGIRKAKQLLLTGDTVSGLEAARIGMVNESVPADELEENVQRLARRIALIPKDLLALNKASVNAAYEVLGFRTAALLGADFDALSHRTRAVLDFANLAEREGLGTALSDRDKKFEVGR